MSELLWRSGHLGWGLFSLLVFSGAWLLLADMVWRLKRIAIRRLLAIMATAWVVGAALVLALVWVSQGRL